MAIESKVNCSHAGLSPSKTVSITSVLPAESNSYVAPYDLFHDIKPVLIVGRILSVVPLSGVFGDSSSHLQFRY
jgi:hypothetical protein